MTILLYRFSFTKKCKVKKLPTVNTPKNIPRSAILGHQNDRALRPNVDRIVAAGTSNSTPYLCSLRDKYLSSFTASASKAAWKNDIVCRNCNRGVTVSRLISRPVNNRLYSMINVPTKLATLTVSNAIDNHNTMLAVVRLNNTRARINF